MTQLGKVVAGVVLGPIVVVVAGIGGCEATKAYYDWQVREMCAKDGGANVYERMAISPAMFKELKGDLGGGLAIPHESMRRPEIPFYWRSEQRTVREGNPRIARTEHLIIRRSDGKVLGKAVFYGRSGGDFPFTVSEASYFQCPQQTHLERQIFFTEGTIK